MKNYLEFEKPLAAFTYDDRNKRHADFQAHFGRSGDGFRLAAFFRALSWVGARSVDQSHNRKTKPPGKIHQPNCFSVALGPGHSEVPFDTAVGVVAFLMADHNESTIAQSGKATHHSMVVGKIPVSSKRSVFVEQRFDVVPAVWPVWVARDEAFSPGRKVLVEVAKHVRSFFVERCGFLFDVRPW